MKASLLGLACALPSATAFGGTESAAQSMDLAVRGAYCPSSNSGLWGNAGIYCLEGDLFFCTNPGAYTSDLRSDCGGCAPARVDTHTHTHSHLPSSKNNNSKSIKHNAALLGSTHGFHECMCLSQAATAALLDRQAHRTRASPAVPLARTPALRRGAGRGPTA